MELLLRGGLRIALRDAGWLPQVAAFVRAVEGAPC